MRSARLFIGQNSSGHSPDRVECQPSFDIKGKKLSLKFCVIVTFPDTHSIDTFSIGENSILISVALLVYIYTQIDVVNLLKVLQNCDRVLHQVVYKGNASNVEIVDYHS